MSHRSLRLSAGLLALALSAGVGVAAPLAAENAPPSPPKGATPAFIPPQGALPTISLDEVQKGQRGYGLSVFSGTDPERFDVEVIGVMRNTSPDVSYILARLTGMGLEKSGVAAGMSGSPVFLDGRLAGAVAFSWPFTNEAIAGITPIESMRQLSSLRGRPPVTTTPPPVALSDLVAGRAPKDLLERQLDKLRPRFANGASSAVQWTTTGFGENSQGMLRRLLGNVTTSGKALPGAAAGDLMPGKAVAVILADGDFMLAAHGTVTDRYGDDVLAFGHPFLGLGPIRVPMATAEVIMVMSSQDSSFKISNAGTIVGAFEQDRLVGIKGRIGAEAPMVPMVLRVSSGDGELAREYKVRLADLPEFMPLLVGSTVLAGLEAASYSTGQQGLDLTARLRIKDYGELTVRQSFDSENAGIDSAAHLLSVIAYLVQNSLERVSFESFEVDVEQALQPRVAALVGAHADRTVVRPGERVTLNLDLVPYRAERERRKLAVDLPEDLPAGRYSLLVGDGGSIDAARLALEPAEPVTLHQALEQLRSYHSRRDLMVLGVYGGAGLSVGGEVMPRLPGSVRSLWSAAGSGSAVALRSTIAQEVREPLDRPIEGLVRIDLEVRRREPVGGDPAAPATPAPSTEKGSS
jgi:hypothetical protein